MKIKLTIIAALLIVGSKLGYGQMTFGVETGAVFTGYNDARIPGNEGTMISLNKELEGNPFFFYRLNAGYTFNSRHNILLLYAPLETNYEGRINKEVRFGKTVFAPNTDLQAIYKFNSYRLTYRYDFVKRQSFEFGLGLTAKIRDAKIALQSSTASDEKTNVGFVPIINFRLMWHLSEKSGLLVQGDALAAPQGRAEDVLIAYTYKISPEFALHAGYRILEGGGDTDSVYSFANFNYAAIGLTYKFDLTK